MPSTACKKKNTDGAIVHTSVLPVGGGHVTNDIATVLRTPIFFFNDTATTEIYTLSLHDALPIYLRLPPQLHRLPAGEVAGRDPARAAPAGRSEEHTSELQSRRHLVCRLLLEKKKNPQLRRPSITRIKTTQRPPPTQ